MCVCVYILCDDEMEMETKTIYLFWFLIELRHRFIHSNESPHWLIRYDALLGIFSLEKTVLFSIQISFFFSLSLGECRLEFDDRFLCLFHFVCVCSELIFGSESYMNLNHSRKKNTQCTASGYGNVDLWSYVRALSGSINRKVNTKNEREVMLTITHTQPTYSPMR